MASIWAQTLRTPQTSQTPQTPRNVRRFGRYSDRSVARPAGGRAAYDRSVARPAGGRGVAALLVGAISLSGCSLVGGSDSDGTPSSSGKPTSVVLVTHESFALPDELKAAFTKQTGLTLDVRAAGDAGTLTNKLVLTQGSPTGDVAFGVDNTFASRALEADVFAAADVTLPAGAADFALPGGEQRLIPIDNANVCVNIDTGWFAERGIPEPQTLADLTRKRYRNLLVIPGAATSSPGLAFLLATIAKYGPPDSSADGSAGGAVTGFETYWSQLMANGAKLTSGWSDAYYVDFTQGGESGKRPIVVSYDSSPAFTIDPETGTSTTKALLDTCFQQVEYAGVLSGAANPKGAEQLIEFLLSPEVQAALPESMYVFPVRADTPLPAEWAAYAQQPTAPVSLDPGEISAGRDDWLRAWTDITTR